ncbi:MAG: EamA family transporter, partial [Solirubrobacteraceae bacterium]
SCDTAPVDRSSRSPKLGYALAASAATLWALNGSVGRFLLDDHLPAARLAELRSIATFAILAAALAAKQPKLLRIQRADLGRLAILGIVGFAGNTALYYAAIARLQIGVAVTIQYLGPLLLLLWLKLAYSRALPRGIWGAAALSALGCFFVVGAYDPGSLDGLGVAAAFGSAVTLAIYLFSSERAGQRYEPLTILVWGFAMATVFWLVAEPLWTFPAHLLSTPRNLGLAAYTVIGGTLIPFVCMITALRHTPAPRAGVVATLEPVLGALLAWPILGQALSPIQIAGGITVITAVVWVRMQRSVVDAELAPAFGNVRRRVPVDPAATPHLLTASAPEPARRPNAYVE